MTVSDSDIRELQVVTPRIEKKLDRFLEQYHEDQQKNADKWDSHEAWEEERMNKVLKEARNNYATKEDVRKVKEEVDNNRKKHNRNLWGLLGLLLTLLGTIAKMFIDFLLSNR